MPKFYTTDEVYYIDNTDYNEPISYDIIGKGLAEKNTFTPLGSTRVCTGFEKVVQSIHHIIRTPIGTVFFNPEFGSKVPSILFEPNNYILEDMVKEYVKEALDKWEKRIDIRGIEVKSRQDMIHIRITFSIKGATNIESYVFSLNRNNPQVV